MKVYKIVERVNNLLAGEMYDYDYIEQFLDEVVDEINETLNTCFPVFSEFINNDDYADDIDYNCFPDKYIRTVVCKGAAHKFYTTDEEGIDSALQYGVEYNKALFMMLRDYSDLVPEEYQDSATGSIKFNINDTVASVIQEPLTDEDYFSEVNINGGVLPAVIKTFRDEESYDIDDETHTLTINVEEGEQTPW